MKVSTNPTTTPWASAIVVHSPQERGAWILPESRSSPKPGSCVNSFMFISSEYGLAFGHPPPPKWAQAVHITTAEEECSDHIQSPRAQEPFQTTGPPCLTPGTHGHCTLCPELVTPWKPSVSGDIAFWPCRLMISDNRQPLQMKRHFPCSSNVS